MQTSKDLIEQFGVEEAVCRALAIISGHTQKIQQRSLLWAVEGYITVIIRVKSEIQSTAYIWNILKKSFSQSLVDGVKGVKLLKNKQGAAFDIPESLKSEVMEILVSNGTNKAFTVEFPTELPDLVEDDRSRMMGQGGYGGGSGGGYGNRNYGNGNSYGNRGDGMRGGGRGGSGGSGASGAGGNSRYGGEKLTHNKLFVGNLGYNTADNNLRGGFESQGLSVVDAFTIKGKFVIT